jgi:hypothetical protein
MNTIKIIARMPRECKLFIILAEENESGLFLICEYKIQATNSAPIKYNISNQPSIYVPTTLFLLCQLLQL